jgi:multidrug resistance efflux pump
MEDIELRSEEVQEILGAPPSWLVRWGTFVWFVTIGLLIGVTWFVQYPDMLEARIQINSATPPVEVFARADGNIQSLMVTDNQEVKQGQVLGVLQSIANYQDINKLDSLLAVLQKTDVSALGGVNVPVTLALGELQADYASFLQNLDMHRFSRTDKTINDAGRIAGLRTQKLNLERQLQLNEKIRKKAKEELDLERTAFERQRTLYANGFISLSELQNYQKRVAEAERNFESMRNADLSVQSEMNALDASISGVAFNTKETSTNTAIRVTESISNLMANLDKWKQTYLITAPMDGRVSLNTRIFSAQQYVRAGEEVLTISPLMGAEPTGRLDLPVMGSGKVRAGQKVVIYLDNYPYAEFGTLEGRVVSKSAIPKENMYTISVAFDKGLKTSLHTDIPFEQSLQGKAEVITDNRRLLTRFLDKVFAYKRS